MDVAFSLETNPVPEYTAEVTKRVSHQEPVTTPWGAQIRSELVYLTGSDDKSVVRELTIATPNLTKDGISPYYIVETDPWTTGEKGFNRDRIETYTKLGYGVLWLHHGGKHSPVAKDKSVSRGAHQMHATLNSLEGSADLKLDELIVNGYSRGAMTADKFIAQASRYKRHVVYSDTEAPCFVRDMDLGEKIYALSHQIPGEIVGLGHVALKIMQRAINEGDPKLPLKFLQTFDAHPINVLQESLWAHALINANVGYSTKAMPKETVGVRTFFMGDIMSQMTDYHDLYKEFPNLQVLQERGPHLAGALPEYQRKKNDRLAHLLTIMCENNMSLAGAAAADRLPKYGNLRSVS